MHFSKLVIRIQTRIGMKMDNAAKVTYTHEIVHRNIKKNMHVVHVRIFTSRYNCTVYVCCFKFVSRCIGIIFNFTFWKHYFEGELLDVEAFVP